MAKFLLLFTASRISLLFKIGVGVSVTLNLFVFTVAMYGLITYEERVEENRKWLKETIEKEVYDQIKFVMPKESGGVYVPNK